MSEEDIEKLTTLKLFEMNGKRVSLKDINQMYNNLQQETQKLKGTIETYDILLKSNVKGTKVIEELEKWLKEQYEFITKALAFTKEIAQEHKVMSICYKNTLDKLKQLQEEE